jgi:hypothetical protein
MLRTGSHWESNLQGTAGAVMMAFLCFAFVMMALASHGR